MQGEPPDGLATLTFEEGTLRLELPGETNGRELDRRGMNPEAMGFVRDDRSGGFRTEATEYASIRRSLAREGTRVIDRVLSTETLDSGSLESPYDLRPYQRAALNDWLETDRWAGGDPKHRGEPTTVEAAPVGVLELPTGSGKTVVALSAIERLATPTLVVVPTIDLLEQWVDELDSAFDASVGQLGGGEQRVERLTVSTYDSAMLRAASIGDRFGLVVFDEVHHLGGERYRDVARLLAAPARLGLTATFERPDGEHETVAELVGPVVHRLDPDDLAGEHLAPYDLKRLTVALTPEERDAYERNQSTFVSYVADSGIRFDSGSDYQKLVKRSGSDPAARNALLARERARQIMLGSEAKLDALEGILDEHRDERTIVFTAHNETAYDVSERFLVPAITHRTGTSERREILRRFREGAYSRIVSSNVLDEGVDVPDASVGIVLSGSSSEREFTQRLGRILRPSPETDRAILYEVISEETGEGRVSERRRG